MSYPRGRRLRHDPRSRDFPAATAQLRSVAWPMGPVLNQRDLGGCTGWSGATTRNSLALIRDGHRAALLGDPAGAAIYSGASLDDGFAGNWPPTDTGASGLGAARAMRKLGLIGSYRHAFGLQHALGALAAGPVMFGLPWPDSMMQPASNGLLTVDEVGPDTEGHEITGAQLVVEDQLVVFQNTWSDAWGANGQAAIRWADLERLLDAQGDVTVPVI